MCDFMFSIWEAAKVMFFALLVMLGIALFSSVCIFIIGLYVGLLSLLSPIAAAGVFVLTVMVVGTLVIGTYNYYSLRRVRKPIEKMNG